MLAVSPRAGGGTPPAGCSASGENKETATERIYSLPCRFLFSLRPWTDGVPWFIVPKGNSQPIVAPMVFVSQVSRGKKPVRPCDYFAEKVSRGHVLWCGVQGTSSPLLRFLLRAKIACLFTQSLRLPGPGIMSLAAPFSGTEVPVFLPARQDFCAFLRI